MRISHGTLALRVLLDDTDRADLIGDDPKPVVWVQLNPKATSKFLVLARHEFPGATQVLLQRNDRVRSTFPDAIIMHHATFRKARKGLPVFAPEPVLVTKSNDHQGVLFDVMRPSMSREPLPRRGPNRATLDKLARAQAAALEQRPDSVNSAGLPKVPPQTPLEAMQEATAIMTLKAAIDVINGAKRRAGDDFQIQVTPAGKLRVLVAYGDDSDGEAEAEGNTEALTAIQTPGEPNVLPINKGIRR